MAHATASIGLENFATAIKAGHHLLHADESSELGGKDTGPNPYDLICSALGACTVITLRMYAERKGWNLRAAHADIRLQRHGKDASIARVLTLEGDLDDEQRMRLVDIAERTPVTLTLKQGMPITTTVA
jgi:putative redox protein